MSITVSGRAERETDTLHILRVAVSAEHEFDGQLSWGENIAQYRQAVRDAVMDQLIDEIFPEKRAAGFPHPLHATTFESGGRVTDNTLSIRHQIVDTFSGEPTGESIARAIASVCSYDVAKLFGREMERSFPEESRQSGDTETE
jgi:S-adenosylmethionine synthetase